MVKKNTLNETLSLLEAEAHYRSLSFGYLLEKLSGKGYALLLILFSLPFCQPIQFPGMSTPFGLILAFIGLRIAFGRRIWLPAALMTKKIPQRVLVKLLYFFKMISTRLRWLFTTRLAHLARLRPFRIAHGLLICFLSLILALPLPIPLTNVLAAIPILILGFGLLEEDGIAIVIAYFFALICFTAFFLMVWLSKVGLHLIK